MASIYTSLAELTHDITTYESNPANNPDVIDALVYTSQFGEPDILSYAQKELYRLALHAGVIPTSIYEHYKMVAQEKTATKATVPAMNIRALTYDTARIIFRCMKDMHVQHSICEIALSEQIYTNQTHAQFASAVLGAALREQYAGPVYLQGDHYQLRAEAYLSDPQSEIGRIQDEIVKAIAAGFYNIDIDASTLVDLSLPSIADQQKTNAYVTAELTRFIRSHQPQGVTISVGGEIGHIGDRNSSTEDFRAFMSEYTGHLGHSIPGLSKVSVQTGTRHGGVVEPDGSIASMPVDFDILASITRLARDEFNVAGAVQHGASTLPDEMFANFPHHDTLEIHLSTGFQNRLFEHLPEGIRSDMYAWVQKTYGNDRKPGQTDEQYLYEHRKKSLGPWKKALWQLSEHDKAPILAATEKYIRMLYTNLGVSKNHTQS